MRAKAELWGDFALPPLRGSASGRPVLRLGWPDDHEISLEFRQIDQAAPPRSMTSAVFGDLAYDFGWRRPYDYKLFGVVFPLTLVIPCDEDAEIEPAQIDAFLNFEAIKDRTSELVTRVIFDYYLGIVEERRTMAGPAFADELAPHLKAPSHLASLIQPTELVVQQTFGSNERVVGLLFDCSWDPSLGLAVKFVNETIQEIGPQDIVL